MSIMLPTIFSLGIHGLDSRAKRASSFIVMAIMGGAIMPKLMSHIADTDKNGMSAGFIVRLACFVFVALYAFFWKKLSGTEGVIGADVHESRSQRETPWKIPLQVRLLSRALPCILCAG